MGEAGELAAQVRRKLRITWSDPATDARVDDLIASADGMLRHRLGIPDGFDLAGPGMENTLLLALCWYMWSDAEDEFEGNYSDMLAQCRRRWEVAAYAEGQGAPSDV